VLTQITNYVTGDAAFAVDQNGVIVLWNSAAEETLGYSASTALGQRCWKLLCGQVIVRTGYLRQPVLLRTLSAQTNGISA